MSSQASQPEQELMIVVLFCEQTMTGQTGGADEIRLRQGAKVRLVPLPCSSKVEINHLVKLLEQGADGIEVVACPPSACRLLGGNQKAKRRVEFVDERLRQLGLGPERVHLTRADRLSLEQLLELAVQSKLLGQCLAQVVVVIDQQDSGRSFHVPGPISERVCQAAPVS